ncbi:MAG: PIN domain-containing protein [Candidatus Marinimicrobia bacterium]|nr:PIN domain-containing protein [Candidatus Neomarinimicrobiota bacterium]
MKVYIDSDIILDIFLNRELFVSESSQILSLCEDKHIIGYTTTLALANIYYLLNKFDKNKSIKALEYLREILIVLAISDEELGLSINSKFKDFEDGIQNFAAEKANCEIIITRNIKDYRTSKLDIKTANEFLRILQL